MKNSPKFFHYWHINCVFIYFNSFFFGKKMCNGWMNRAPSYPSPIVTWSMMIEFVIFTLSPMWQWGPIMDFLMLTFSARRVHSPSMLSGPTWSNQNFFHIIFKNTIFWTIHFRHTVIFPQLFSLLFHIIFENIIFWVNHFHHIVIFPIILSAVVFTCDFGGRLTVGWMKAKSAFGKNVRIFLVICK